MARAPGVAVRSKLWDKSVVKKFKGAAERAEKPIDLTLREITRSGGVLWRAYQLEEPCAVFAGDLGHTDTSILRTAGARKRKRRESPNLLKRHAR